jgi:hypothetical protein
LPLRLGIGLEQFAQVVRSENGVTRLSEWSAQNVTWVGPQIDLKWRWWGGGSLGHLRRDLVRQLLVVLVEELSMKDYLLLNPLTNFHPEFVFTK